MEINNQNLPPQFSSEPTPTIKWYKHKSVWIVVALAIIAGGLSYVALKPKPNPEIGITPVSLTEQNPSSITQEATTTTSTPVVIDTSKWNNPQIFIDQVSYYAPVTLPTSTLSSYFKVISEGGGQTLDYMEVQEFGTVNSGIFQGSKLVDVIIPSSGEGDTDHYFRFLELPANNNWGLPSVFLQNYSDEGNEDGDTLSDQGIAIATVSSQLITVKGFELPNTLQESGPNQSVTLAQDSVKYPIDVIADSSFTQNLNLAFNDPKIGSVYGYKLPYIDNAFYDYADNYFVNLPDGTYATYNLTNSIVHTETSNNVTTTTVDSIIWQDGMVTPPGLTYAPDGYGGIDCVERTHQQDLPINNSQDWVGLTQTGKTSGGNPIYEFSSDSKVLKDFYNNDISMPLDSKGNALPKPSYNDFIASHPLFVWTDPFGYKEVFVKEEYDTPVDGCGGKPVIYLYPTKPTNVEVQVNPVDGISSSYPDYQNGWNVFAQPDGTLTSNNQTYPYLFWEGGLGSDYHMPEQGFVTAQSGVKQLLDNKLSLIGLNEKEIGDFEQFWLPRMQSSPYYFVTFTVNQQMEQYAPLSISPKPDTTIRVMMDYKPLEQLQAVEPLELPHTSRIGFTVVEWGGILK